jgi:hypothetical protein
VERIWPVRRTTPEEQKTTRNLHQDSCIRNRVSNWGQHEENANADQWNHISIIHLQSDLLLVQTSASTVRRRYADGSLYTATFSENARHETYPLRHFKVQFNLECVYLLTYCLYSSESFIFIIRITLLSFLFLSPFPLAVYFVPFSFIFVVLFFLPLCLSRSHSDCWVTTFVSQVLYV